MDSKSLSATYRLNTFISIFLIFFFAYSGKAQCAGNDAALTICDYANPANQSIDLFPLLGGSPTPGGVWSDPLQQVGVLTPGGILNAWNIHISGVYTFVYSVNAPGCSDTSTVTLTLGGYSGIPSPNGSACNNDDHVNLFQFFVGTPPNPHLNGSWHDDDNSNALNGNFLNATVSGLGTFHFTYTMPAIGTCPSVSSTITVTVFKVPFPGIPSRLILCNTIDFSQLTNFNLFNLLAGPDPGGLWSELGTSELSDPLDSFIDIQHLYNTFGLGTYNFTYTVYPANPVCEIKKATVQIVIEAPLDFTGAVFTVHQDICENELGTATFSATLTQGTIINPLGSYLITYEVTAGTNPPVSHTATASFAPGGDLIFPLPAAYFPQVGTYNVTITHIVWNGNFGVCENIIDASDDLHVYPIPKINAATVVINPVCNGSDIAVQLSGTNNLGTGDYQITYNLTGANILPAQTITISAVAGSAAFTIPAALVPNSGTTTIHFTHIVNVATGCENSSTLIKAFVINPIVTVTVSATINDVCQNDPVVVSLNGLATLSGITLVYNLSGANSSSGQTVTLPISLGHAGFTIPPDQIPATGATTFTIVSITNSATTCPVIINTVSDEFTINVIPPAPAANNAAFCATQHATVGDLLPNGSQFAWYDSAAGLNPLSNDTALTSGNYYVSEIDQSVNCPSTRTMISVAITTVPNPVLNPDGASFCGIDNPTLTNLTANTNSGSIAWFDAPQGNQLPDSDLLHQGATYYGYGLSENGCQSEQVLAVTVTLTDCDNTNYNFFIPDGFSPNGDNVNDVFEIPEIQYLFPDYTLEIYNRYGDLMFKGNINSPAWDGKNSKSTSLVDGIAPNGVYFYIVNFNKDNAPPRQGFLYLNR